MSTAETAVAKTHPFIEAALGRPHERIPVWMMRQAGRYLPEYREVRAKHTFLEMCHTPEVAAEITLQPLRRFDLDAAIIFSDILIFLPAMGMPVDFPTGGPVVERPIASAADVDKLGPLDPKKHIPEVYDAISLTAEKLAGERPLIGFCGAPFTLACYAIEGKGSKEFAGARSFMHQNPEATKMLLDKLADAAFLHLAAQVEAGASVVQIFDSWAGLLSRADFDEFAKPYLTRVVERARPLGVPIIAFARGISAPWLDGIGADVYSIDWRDDIRAAYDAVGGAGVQGNLDPVLLLASKEKAVASAQEICRSMAGIDRYIFNLGHGVLQHTPPENVQAVIRAVHSFK
jgi:uroporphyrinogen decarboxylase